MDDLKIIALYLARDQRAISETAEKYENLCYSLAGNILSNPEDIAECINDTYLALWNAIPPEPRDFKAFVCRTAKNLALKKFRYNTEQKRDERLSASWSELEKTLPDSRINPDFSESAIGEYISSFLRTEKELSRNIFICKYFMFYSDSEIAKRYLLSPGNVRITLHRTRKRLKDYLEKEGIDV